jgi:hypothetical protein
MQTQAIVFTANHQASLQPVTIPDRRDDRQLFPDIAVQKSFFQ